MVLQLEDPLAYTIAHFQEVARQNRFPENNKVEHESERCVICHPELLSRDPFLTYLDVVTQSVKVRRPRLDQGMLDEINKDLTLLGRPERVSLDDLMTGRAEAVRFWVDWIREALTTGLDLLSIHSPGSGEFSLEDAEEMGMEEEVERSIREIMDYQKANL